MISYKTIHWTAENCAKGIAKGRNGLIKLFAIIISNAANERQGQIHAAIRSDMETDEIGEILTDQSLNSGFSEVTMNEFRKAGEEAVRKGLTIYTIDNLRERKAYSAFKLNLQFF